METTTAIEEAPQGIQMKSNGKADESGFSGNNKAAERKVVSRLQEAIDDRGRYAYRLKDLAIGYAAAQGCSEVAAKDKINDLFQDQMGLGMREYLENHRLERGLSVESKHSNGR